MIAQVDHDVLVAIIGALALVLVAVIGVVPRRTARKVTNDSGVLEKLDQLLEITTANAVRIDAAAERRAQEHQELKDLLQTVLAQRRWKGQ